MVIADADQGINIGWWCAQKDNQDVRARTILNKLSKSNVCDQVMPDGYSRNESTSIEFLAKRPSPVEHFYFGPSTGLDLPY
ncbi:hypothetical protein M569_00128 [Genlisea aurea]|uniref:Uncharacterized protein n=1 Tax=Genlisea aurea TaxID=192259 RepID=S8D4G5_9LAMI|nr:hypothetical protein M569_00128 [Genlisea aurea]